MTFTFVVLALTILLLLSGRLRPDLVALMSLLALFLGGIVATQQAAVTASPSPYRSRARS